MTEPGERAKMKASIVPHSLPAGAKPPDGQLTTIAYAESVVKRERTVRSKGPRSGGNL